MHSVSDLEEPACESSHFVSAVAKSIPSYSPIAKRTRRQCAACKLIITMKFNH